MEKTRLANTSFSKRLKPFINWLIHEKPLWLRLAPLAFLAIFITTSFLWWSDISQTQDILRDTLKARVENTPQPYKGLEAYMLSDLNPSIDEFLGKATVTEDYVKSEKCINELLFEQGKNTGSENTSPKPSNQPQNCDPEEYATFKEDLTSLRLQPAAPSGYITDSKQGFLFVPGTVSGVPYFSTLDEPKIISNLIKTRDELKTDIIASQKIAGRLAKFQNVQVFNDLTSKSPVINNSPVQSYFMSQTGVVRIYASKVKAEDQSDYYSSQFNPTTFFPERPYFSNMLKGTGTLPLGQVSSGEKVRNVFKPTAPYIDLGGNGIVVTLSRNIISPNSKAGIFLDFGMSPEIINKIKSKLKNIGGSVIETSWQVEGEGKNHKASPILGSKDPGNLEYSIKKCADNNSLSDIFGKIYDLSPDDKPGKITFTVPIARPEPDVNIQSPTTITLLYCELDLGWFQGLIYIKAGSIVISFALFLLFIILLVVDYVMRLNEQEKAFQSVASVMSRVPVAYCRLDEQDRFIEINEAFATMLDYQSYLQAKGELIDKQKFEDLLVDEISRATYKRIQNTRRDKESTDPYNVEIRKKNGTVKVQVHGARVPMPMSPRKDTPQTFGILLKREGEVAPAKTMPSARYFGSPNKAFESLDLFVLMQFKPEFDRIYNEHIVKIAGKLRLKVDRADNIFSTEPVMSDVWGAIRAAQVIIADCTGRNPNVFYEIGLAHAMDKPVILITQNDDDIPFDLRHFRHFTYKYEDIEKFERELEKILIKQFGINSNQSE